MPLQNRHDRCQKNEQLSFFFLLRGLMRILKICRIRKFKLGQQDIEKS